MPRLIRSNNGVIEIATTRLYNADYGTIMVADCTTATVLPDGWTYYADDVELDDFAASWQQPTDATTAYPVGAIVSHNGTRWRSTIIGNVWEPGVTGWVYADSDIPAWIQPLGAHDAYALDAIVSHGGKLWRSLVDANVWQPGVSGWREAVLMPPSGVAPAPPAWVQPTWAGDAYQIGDRVTHNGQTWTSTAANNVWEPGVYGWTAD